MMTTQRRIQFIYGQAAWMLTAVLVLTILDTFSYELLYVVCFIGFLVVTQLTSPFTIQPRWRSPLPWLIALGVLVFGIIVVRRILAILPPGVI